MPEPIQHPRGSDASIGDRDLTSWHSRTGRHLLEAVSGVARTLQPVAGRVARWSVANLAFVVFAVLALVAIAALLEVVENVYENVVNSNGLAGLDQPVLDAMVSARGPRLDSAVTAYTDIGGPVGMPILATAAVVALAVWRRRWTPVVVTVIAAAGSFVMTVVGKDLVDRARPPAALAVPPLEVSPSFPSGHTLNATVLTTVIVYLLLIETTAAWQRLTAVTVGAVFVVTMGLSRVYLGHHWLTDVIAGWAIGFAWALAVITAHRLWLTLRGSGASDPQPARGHTA